MSLQSMSLMPIIVPLQNRDILPQAPSVSVSKVSTDAHVFFSVKDAEYARFPPRHRLHFLQGAIRRTILGYDNLIGKIGLLPQNTLQRFLDIHLMIIRQDKNADFGLVHYLALLSAFVIP
jgi:hypothetical protein